MDSILEISRQTHSEIERFERALYTLLSRPNPTHEARIRTHHSASTVLDRIEGRVKTLDALYADESGREQELNALSAPPNNPSDLSEFYNRLAKIQEHHAKYPDSSMDPFEYELSALIEEPDPEAGVDEEVDEDEDPVALMFSGEEGYGKYLDLYANHIAYSNLKNIPKRPGYLQYLDLLISAEQGSLHRELNKDIRSHKDYETYIKALHSYLLSFAHRVQPLIDVDTLQQEAIAEFDKKWDAGEFADEWEDTKSSKGTGEGSGIWCAACQRSYAKQTVYDAHLTSKKHVKAAARLSSNGTSTTDTSAPSAPASTTNGPSHTALRLRSAALHTYLSHALITQPSLGLVATLTDTKANVERRFSLTAREREQEQLEKPAATVVPKPADEEGAEEPEEEERIYNPLKLPLGWDGKPIPFWLYKLHGLGVEYRCEICSDQVYMGRKNFERHFQEARHAFGMRALGLPNTKHFHEIVKIEGALALAERLKQEGRHEIFEQETMEELEDDEGNVYSRKTYEDLKKQGLI